MTRILHQAEKGVHVAYCTVCVVCVCGCHRGKITVKGAVVLKSLMYDVSISTQMYMHRSVGFVVCMLIP